MAEPSANRNLAIRLLTSVVVVPLLLAALFVAPSWVWFAVVLCACVVGGLELFGMTHPGDRVAQAVGALATAAASAALYFYASDPRVLVTLMVVVVLQGALMPLWRLGEIKTAALRVFSGMAGPLYVGVLLTTVASIHRDHFDTGGPGMVVMILAIAWLGDTGGYFAGRFLGKTPLYPAVSPKKTREGFVGSLLGSVVGGVGAQLLLVPALPTLHIAVLALIAGALGQLGDLVESLLKRSTGIKDSGSIVPGHGGILDRLDAVLVVSPLVYLYLRWFTPLG